MRKINGAFWELMVLFENKLNGCPDSLTTNFSTVMYDIQVTSIMNSCLVIYSIRCVRVLQLTQLCVITDVLRILHTQY